MLSQCETREAFKWTLHTDKKEAPSSIKLVSEQALLIERLIWSLPLSASEPIYLHLCVAPLKQLV